MKIVGVIAEYNPFHNGHLYHLEQAKKLTGADKVIAVMSGNFVQRGAPAMLDKYSRAKMALSCGADLVLELPVYYSCASAEYFSFGGVSLLNELNIVDSLCFGSESVDLPLYQTVADILIKEPDAYRSLLKSAVTEGLSYPAARQKALTLYMNHPSVSGYPSDPHDFDFLSSPNCILGLEYLKALKKLDSSIQPVLLKRTINGYHDKDLNEQYISSASSIRRAISLNNRDSVHLLQKQLPSEAYEILKSVFSGTAPITADDFSQMVQYRLLMASRPEDFEKYLDVSSDLANRIWNLRHTYTSFEEFILKLKTKQMTQTRISRALIHILLGITANEVSKALHSEHPVPYIRVLGFRKNSCELLSLIKKRCSLPILTKLADAHDILKKESAPYALKMLESDLTSSHIYHSGVTCKFHNKGYNEFTQQIVRL